jgi:hypothetical protein
VAVPDEYDGHSWLLLAEDAVSGEAVGSMRITTRAGGLLEAEEHFGLPLFLRVPSTVEITRFAILPAYRTKTRIVPIVFFGLVKLAVLFMERIRVRRLVVCATPERVWGYTWLNLQATGRIARYEKLANAEHQLLFCDLREAARVRGHRFKEAILEASHPEIIVPRRIPARGLGIDATRDPLRVAQAGLRA